MSRGNMQRAATWCVVLVIAVTPCGVRASTTLYIRDDGGQVKFGSNLDVVLYRKNAETLRTNSSLEVQGNVTVGNAVLTNAALSQLLGFLGHFILTPTNITVSNPGKGGMFTTVTAALHSLKNKVICANVYIVVASDTYTWPVIDVSNVPYGGFIFITGATTNPAAVKITTADTNRAVFASGNPIGGIVTVQYMTFYASAVSVGYGIETLYGGSVQGNGLVLYNFHLSVISLSGYIYTPGIKSYNSYWGVQAQGFAQIFVPYGLFSGQGTTVASSYGLVSQVYAYLYAAGTTIENFYFLVNCEYWGFVSNNGGAMIFGASGGGNVNGCTGSNSPDGSVFPIAQS